MQKCVSLVNQQSQATIPKTDFNTYLPWKAEYSCHIWQQSCCHGNQNRRSSHFLVQTADLQGSSDTQNTWSRIRASDGPWKTNPEMDKTIMTIPESINLMGQQRIVSLLHLFLGYLIILLQILHLKHLIYAKGTTRNWFSFCLFVSCLVKNKLWLLKKLKNKAQFAETWLPGTRH